VYYSHTDGFFELGNISLTRFLVQLLTGTTTLPTHLLSEKFAKEPHRFATLDELS